ncbi:MAG TPA: hypothetical protein VGF99_15790, partial [Myxococcota bacterium]
DTVADDLVAARLLFCAKAAVFKAAFARDGVFLEHADVQLVTPGPLSSTARFKTATGHVVDVVVRRSPRLLAFARG